MQLNGRAQGPDYGEPFRRSWARTVGIAAITVVAVAGIALLVRGAGLDEGLGDRIEAAAREANGDPVLLRDFTDFSWSRACIFPPSPTADRVERSFGYAWTHAISIDAVTVIFANGPNIQRQTHLAPDLAEMPPPTGICQPADVAAVQFRVP